MHQKKKQKKRVKMIKIKNNQIELKNDKKDNK